MVPVIYWQLINEDLLHTTQGWDSAQLHSRQVPSWIPGIAKRARLFASFFEPNSGSTYTVYSVWKVLDRVSRLLILALFS